MPQKIIYIINPIAGNHTKKGLHEYIENATNENGIPFHIFPSVASGDYSFLRSLIREEKITDVVIAGGDGTVSQVVSSLMKEEVNLVLFHADLEMGWHWLLKFPNNLPKR
jgi:diacylglycerol kinase family enzyme